jgi:hypothetical protein
MPDKNAAYIDIVKGVAGVSFATCPVSIYEIL